MLAQDAYTDSRWGGRAFDEKSGYRTTTILCVPVSDSKGALIGVCQMINKGGVSSFTSKLASTVACDSQFVLRERLRVGTGW